jgi:hypothetical protein
MNEGNHAMAMEATYIDLLVDKTKNFQVIDVTYNNEAVITAEEDIVMNYPIDITFCDDSNQPVSPAPVLEPGDVLQVCVSTPSTDASVKDVKSVYFENTDVNVGGSTLKFDVIDANGDEMNGQTLKVCYNGVCNVKTLTFSLLYQYDKNNDGQLDDVHDYATFKGTAVMGFARRHLKQKNEHGRRLATVTTFDSDIGRNLAAPASIEASMSTSSSNKNGSALYGGAIGGAVAVAALAAVAVVLMRRRIQQGKRHGGDDSNEAASANVSGSGPGMI